MQMRDANTQTMPDPFSPHHNKSDLSTQRCQCKSKTIMAVCLNASPSQAAQSAFLARPPMARTASPALCRHTRCPSTDGSYRQSSPLSPHALPVNVTQRASLRYCSLYFLRFPQQYCPQLHTSLSSGPFRPQPPWDSRKDTRDAWLLGL